MNEERVEGAEGRADCCDWCGYVGAPVEENIDEEGLCRLCAATRPHNFKRLVSPYDLHAVLHQTVCYVGNVLLWEGMRGKPDRSDEE